MTPPAVSPAESLDEAMEELESAEDFLHFFSIPFEQKVVHVNRLHIMQRYHDYLKSAEGLADCGHAARFAVYQQLLERAYADFVDSDAQAEKVFKVFRMHEPQQSFVPLDQLLG
jgi:nitrogenase-stabilizing/protective protein